MSDESHSLTVRAYTPEDAAMVAGWWDDRQEPIPLQAIPFPFAVLPPLGVVVCDEFGPSAALWCYECYGVGVCFLEFPVSRPGQGVKRARTAFTFAVEACKALAGKSVEPAGEYHFFRAFTLPPIARALKRMGFEVEPTPRIAANLYHPT